MGAVGAQLKMNRIAGFARPSSMHLIPSCGRGDLLFAETFECVRAGANATEFCRLITYKSFSRKTIFSASEISYS
jgi:hypothetical protein